MHFLAALAFILFLTTSALKQKERKLALSLHNKLRSQVAKGQVKVQGGNLPRGHNIYKLRYSAEVEKYAQENANHCRFGHTDENTLRRLDQGQNIYWHSSKMRDSDAIRHALDVFVREKEKYYANPGLRTSPGTGHFTQMIWGKTAEVGCAVARCQSGTYTTCNYRPGGNVGERPIYDAGGTCTNSKHCNAYPKSKCNAKSGLCETTADVTKYKRTQSPNRHTSIPIPGFPNFNPQTWFQYQPNRFPQSWTQYQPSDRTTYNIRWKHVPAENGNYGRQTWSH